MKKIDITEYETSGYTRGFLDIIEVRDIEPESRTATFVAATENGVQTMAGTEYLRMAGADFTRYKINPVVLDLHANRPYVTASNIVGRGDIWVEGKKLLVKIVFAATRRASEIWELVRTGFLRTVSIGFVPNRAAMRVLGPGETDGEGDDIVSGPGVVINKWELFEITMVPVPADANALRRGFFDSDGEGLLPVIHSLADTLRRLTVATNSDEEKDMADETKEKGEARATVVEVKTPTETSVVHSTPEEDAGRSLAALTVAIRAIAPRGMDKVADELIAQGADVPTARKRFIEELAKGSEAVGTPEPPKPTATGEQKPDTRSADLPDNDFKRAICG